jgi:hypothetical protein
MGLVEHEPEMQWFLAQSVRNATGGSLPLINGD